MNSDQKEIIYLDYNATTPVDPEVALAMRPYLDEYFGNPSSIHEFGVKAKLTVEKARQQVAAMLGCLPAEIIFTSGGTESNNYAIKGTAFATKGKGKHIITSAIEHPAVIEVCLYLEQKGFRITWLPVDEFGIVNPEDIEKAITPETILITVMHANNEVGSIQPIREIGMIARKHGIVFHTDAAQSCGKIAVNVNELNVDLLSVAGHKLYAPKGIGALYIRQGTRLEKLIHGADHEMNLRAGTENVLEIVGFGKACELIEGNRQEAIGKRQEAREPRTENREPRTEALGTRHEGVVKNQNYLEWLRDLLFEGIASEIPEIRLNGHPVKRLPNTLSLGFPGVDASRLLSELKGIAASAGAACHSDRTDISPVLSAMHVPAKFAIGTIRFSLGRMTTKDEIERAIPIISNAYKALAGSRQLAVGSRQSAVGSRQLAVSSRQSAVSSQQSTVGSQQSAVGSQQSVVGIRLTEYTHSLGCACKIRPQELEKILKMLPVPVDPDILIGIKTSDDAAVYRINAETAIVQTVDFIPPVVDDPYEYGAIAAANALSDIYAMGGKPVFALSIVGFPDKLLPYEVLELILKGAADKTTEAGINIIGGHSIEDPEPKFGLVVTGVVHPDKILTNSGAKTGDAIILTKPLGTGILSTGIKRGMVDLPTQTRMIRIMSELNKKACDVMVNFPVNSCTDVTGFGLLGHLKEMVKGSGISAELWADNIPVMEGVHELVAANIIPGGTRNNLAYVSDITEWDKEISEQVKLILADAQTSGGLLIALPNNFSERFLGELHSNGVKEADVIGRFINVGNRILVINSRRK